MARGVNKVILVGNLGSDPETRSTANGNSMTNISIATMDSWKDKSTGETKERTEWHRVVFFGRLADIAGQYLQKGRQVYIEGSIRTRKWQDQNGQDRYTTEIIGNELEMLGSNAGDNFPKDKMNQPSSTTGPDQSDPFSDGSDIDHIPF